MAIDQQAMSNVLSFGAIALSMFAIKRSATKEDAAAADQRMDERIQLALGKDVALIKQELQNISKALMSSSELVRNTVDATTNAITEAAEVMIKIAK